jgi:hypothetical protein
LIYINQVSLIARHSTICSLLVLARTVLREIRAQSDTLSESEPAFPSIWHTAVPSVRYRGREGGEGREDREERERGIGEESEKSFFNFSNFFYIVCRSYTTACGNEAERLFQKIESQASQLLLLDITPTQKGNTHLHSPNLQPLNQTLHKDYKQDQCIISSGNTPSWPLPIPPQQYITKLFKLTKDWNHAMQVLSYLYS